MNNKYYLYEVIMKESSIKGDGILSLTKSLDQGIILDKKIMNAMIDKIGNKLLDLRDEGLGTSPDSEDLQGVLEDLEELEKANVYPCKIEYFSNFSKDLYDIQVEDLMDYLDDYDINVMDYVEDFISLDNLNDMQIDEIYDRINWEKVPYSLYVRFVKGGYESDDKEELIKIFVNQNRKEN